jgi:hypothetical protein
MSLLRKSSSRRGAPDEVPAAPELRRVRVKCLSCGWSGVWECPGVEWVSERIRYWSWCPGSCFAHRVLKGLQYVWDMEDVTDGL